jgi:hypothetical protein
VEEKMRTLLLLGSVLLAIPCLAQTKRVPAPKAAYGMTGTVIPQLVDGGNYRTTIYVTNYSNAQEGYWLQLVNEDGTPATFHFLELGTQSKPFGGFLQPLATDVYHTDGTLAAEQIGWAYADPSGTGQDISIYSIIESANPITGVWTTQSMVVSDFVFVQDTENPVMQFDQTNGVVCGVAIANYLSYATANIIIDALDAKGNVLASAPVTLLPLHHLQFILTSLFPTSAGIVGSIRVRNAAPGDANSITLMGIKTTPYKSGWTQTSLPVLQLLN